MTTATKTLPTVRPETLTLLQPASASPHVTQPADLGWEHRGNQGDWYTFLVWVACFLLMAFMLAYDLIASLLGL